MADEETATYCGFACDKTEDMNKPHKCTAGARCAYAGGAIKMQLEPRRPFAWFSRLPYAQDPNFARRYHIVCAPVLAIDAAASPMGDTEERTEERHFNVFSSDDLVNPAFENFAEFFPHGSRERELLSRYFAWIILRSQTGENFDAGTRGSVRREWQRFKELAEIDFSRGDLRKAAGKAAPSKRGENDDIKMSQD